MNKKIIPILFLLILVLSCRKDLKESDRNWNPYVINEVLVFESSEKELDTLVINKIIDNAVSSGPTPELYRSTYLMVYGKRLKIKENRFPNNEILNVSSSTPNKSSEVGFTLNFKNAWFAGWGFKIEDLDKYQIMSVSTKAGIFDDVIKLEPVVKHPEREDEVRYMYWSKNEGYIKFERADGFTWELIEKYVP